VHESAVDLNKCLPNSKHILANFGHTWPLESPELFSSVLSMINGNPLHDILLKL